MPSSVSTPSARKSRHSGTSRLTLGSSTSIAPGRSRASWERRKRRSVLGKGSLGLMHLAVPTTLCLGGPCAGGGTVSTTSTFAAARSCATITFSLPPTMK